MKTTNYKKLYNKIFKILGDLTPLTVDCGVLCEGACCKGDKNKGMILFPYEETVLSVTKTEFGGRLAVCDGKCDRKNRPLACRIFPFFPTVDEKGRVFIEKDFRAANLCPLLEHSDEIIFNPKFFKALKKAGKLLAKDKEILDFMRSSTEEIDTYYDFLGE
jgi:hypothetical protein